MLTFGVFIYHTDLNEEPSLDGEPSSDREPSCFCSSTIFTLEVGVTCPGSLLGDLVVAAGVDVAHVGLSAGTGVIFGV